MHKLEIAVHQLDRAIKLFLDEKDYICSITLCGAAEEMLGKELQRSGEASASDSLAKSLQEKHANDLTVKYIRDKHLNEARNAIKHFNLQEESAFETDWESQAIQMLARACSNIIKVEVDPTEQFHRFIAWSKTYDRANK